MALTQRQWNEMSTGAQAEYLRSNEIKVRTQSFLDHNSTVNDPKVFIGRQAVCGGVILTPWMDSEEEIVLASARERIKEIAGEQPTA